MKRKCLAHRESTLFPSPYGVSFILMSDKYEKDWKGMLWFPSPYGVSFILIKFKRWINRSCRKCYKFPSPYGVSFILMSTDIKIQVYIL